MSAYRASSAMLEACCEASRSCLVRWDAALHAGGDIAQVTGEISDSLVSAEPGVVDTLDRLVGVALEEPPHERTNSGGMRRHLFGCAPFRRKDGMQVIPPFSLVQVEDHVPHTVTRIEVASRWIGQPSQAARQSAPGLEVAIRNAGVGAACLGGECRCKYLFLAGQAAPFRLPFEEVPQGRVIQAVPARFLSGRQDERAELFSSNLRALAGSIGVNVVRSSQVAVPGVSRRASPSAEEAHGPPGRVRIPLRLPELRIELPYANRQALEIGRNRVPRRISSRTKCR